VCENNWEKLNEIFIALAAQGIRPEASFPTIKLYSFEQFSRKVSIVDRHFLMSSVTSAFHATNAEIIDQAGNDDKQLCRFEFFEILIRICKGKYLDPKKETTLVAAFERLLKENILPHYYVILPWQRFRDLQLWTIPLNDVF